MKVEYIKRGRQLVGIIKMKVEIISKFDIKNRWLLKIDGESYVYGYNNFLTPGNTHLSKFYEKIDENSTINAVLPMNESNPQETIEQFYRLQLLK